ncbi:hypothetical protein FOA52_000425 [Chlamydomonas sp. UWO 241]|nr:hypothetical protein FOA52_000425 [Chlamydomonas sp. UWO 241]
MASSSSTSTLRHDDRVFCGEGGHAEAFHRDGSALLMVSLVTDEFLDLEARRDRAKAQKLRALRDKAVTDSRAILAAFHKLQAEHALVAPADPRGSGLFSSSAAGTNLFALRASDFDNANTAWRHLLCVALGVFCDADSEAYIDAVKEGRQPPAPTRTAFRNSVPGLGRLLEERMMDLYRSTAMPAAECAGIAPLAQLQAQAPRRPKLCEVFEGLEPRRVDSNVGHNTTGEGPRACANCCAIAPTAASGLTLEFKKCGKCNAVRYCSKECQCAHWVIHGPLMCEHYRWKVAANEKARAALPAALAAIDEVLKGIDVKALFNNEADAEAVQEAVRNPLTFEMLARATPEQQDRMLHARLFPRIQRTRPEFAAKVTRALLEWHADGVPCCDTAELLAVLDGRASRGPGALYWLVDEVMDALKLGK